MRKCAPDDSSEQELETFVPCMLLLAACRLLPGMQVDPKMSELVRGSSGLMTEKETKLTKECQALKERSQLMEAQLEFLRYER